MKFPNRSLATIAALACLSVIAPAAPAAVNDVIDTDAWRFRVLLDDKPIGYHDFVVRRTGEGEYVEIDARFDVSFLRIPVYSYRHTNSETWRDGCLQQLTSRTDDNGETMSVNAHREQGRVVIETTQQVRAVEAACVHSFAYWNRGIVDEDVLLNAQTGEMVPVDIVKVEPTPSAERFDRSGLDAYRIDSRDGKVRIEVGYARDSGRWTYLESTLDNGRVLRYLPTDATAAIAPDDGGKRS